MSLVKSVVAKPTTVLILFIVVFSLCLYSALSLPLDLFPDMEIPYLLVNTSYANADPEEVERSVTRLLESAVSSVTGIKKVTSTSSTGQSSVMLEMNYGVNLDSAAIDLRDRIDMVKQALPEEAGAPVIIKMDPSMLPIMSFMLIGKRSAEELRQIAEDIVTPRLEQIDGVASVNISGGRTKAIIVEVPRDRLEAYGLTITQIAQMISTQNVQGSGGTITEGDYNYSITTSGDYNSIDDIKKTVISYKASTPTSYGAQGTLQKILLRDIADVYEGYKTQTSLAYFNGESGVSLSIQKQSGKNSVETAKKAREQMARLKESLPSDVQIVETSNATDIIEHSLNQVFSSAVQGALLAVLVLFVFLRSVRSTIIIGLTIPVSLVITLGLVYFAGFTLNIMTLAGLTLGVGMLVDNSIVILENIYSYRERGTKLTVSAILGSQEMVLSIVSSTLTTICVFLPLIMYQNKLGMIGQVFEGLTFTVVFSLLCSLVVAIILVPVLASRYIKIGTGVHNHKIALFKLIDDGAGKFFDMLDNAYAKAVRAVVRHRRISVLVIFALFVGACCLIPRLGFIYMPTQQADSVSVNLTMPQGTRLEVTEGVIVQMEHIARQEINGIRACSITVGGSAGSENSASLTIVLPPYSERTDTEASVKQKLRRHFADFPGAEFSFGESMMSLSGSGVDVIIKSDDLDKARKTASAVQNVLLTKASHVVSEPSCDLQDGLPQVKIIIDREKLYTLGLNIYSVNNEIKANISGVTATKLRNSGAETDVVVMLNSKDKAKLQDLDNIFVNNSSGARIPLSSFAHYQETTSPLSIKRENQTRTLHVTASPLPGLSLGDVQASVEKIISENVPHEENVRIEYGGDYQTTKDNFIQFVIIIFMAAVLVFAVMASLFESFIDPFIILFTIPLSLIGIVAIYFVMQAQLNLITAVGLLILVGIIVNNGIVLVDYTNLLRERGYSLEEACVEAAKNRLRPILMTTLTTVLALVPMAFFPGEGSEMVQPIGLTVFGGLSFGTLMTLFLMPTLYFIINNKRLKRAQKKAYKLQQRQNAQSGTIATQSVFATNSAPKGDADGEA